MSQTDRQTVILNRYLLKRNCLALWQPCHMFIKCVVSNIWWSDFFSWRETASNKCFCNIIITRVTRPSPSWTRYQLVFYFRLSSAVRWLTEDLTRASVSLTTRWPWGACCPCWGPRRVTAPTTSVSRTDCRGPARLKAAPITSWWWWWVGCWWPLSCTS